jgi:hypothetical protein
VQNLFGRPTSDSFIFWDPFDSKTQQLLKIGNFIKITFVLLEIFLWEVTFVQDLSTQGTKRNSEVFSEKMQVMD